MSGSYLTNHFLIAMPTLADRNFSRTVTYLCEHNAHGAIGIVINRPSELTLGDLFDHLQIPAADPEVRARPLFLGGPVQRERGFVLHAPSDRWDSSLQVSEQIALTTSKDILTAIANGDGPSRFLVALGYAGWGPGQLEAEIAANAWLSGPADVDLIFDGPTEMRWQAAAALLGVDLALLSSHVGHA